MNQTLEVTFIVPTAFAVFFGLVAIIEFVAFLTSNVHVAWRLGCMQSIFACLFCLAYALYYGQEHSGNECYILVSFSSYFFFFHQMLMVGYYSQIIPYPYGKVTLECVMFLLLNIFGIVTILTLVKSEMLDGYCYDARAFKWILCICILILVYLPALIITGIHEQSGAFFRGLSKHPLFFGHSILTMVFACLILASVSYPGDPLWSSFVEQGVYFDCIWLFLTHVEIRLSDFRWLPKRCQCEKPVVSVLAPAPAVQPPIKGVDDDASEVDVESVADTESVV
jgi:hypothetical protein